MNDNVKPGGETAEGTRPRGRILSMDDILAGLSDLAENGDGGQRVQAYRMLTSMNQTQASLPDPKPDIDMIARLSRLMKAAGHNLSQLAYKHAFPFSKGNAYDAPKITETQANLKLDYTKLPKTLRQYYKMFPEVKHRGTPKGWPGRRGPEVQVEWLRQKSVQILVDRAQKEAEEIAKRDREITDDKSPLYEEEIGRASCRERV
jgi:hypothetical protein